MLGQTERNGCSSPTRPALLAWWPGAPLASGMVEPHPADATQRNVWMRGYQGCCGLMGLGDRVGCGDAVGCGDPMGYGDPMGCGASMACGDPIGYGDPVASATASFTGDIQLKPVQLEPYQVVELLSAL